MDQRHQDYIDYYRVRMQKYENNSVYKNSLEAEKAIYDAISGIQELEEFRKKMQSGNLNVKCGIALVKDQETARLQHYKEISEPIRSHAPERILDMVDNVSTDMDLVEKVNKVNSEVGIEVSVDNLIRQVIYDLDALENIEVWQNAEVPAEYKQRVNIEYSAENKAEYQKILNGNILPRAREWDPNWDFDYSLLWEERHRRRIFFSDELLKKRIEQHKKYRGVS
jgi:hypothetical protein